MEKKVQEETGLDGSSHPWPAQRQLSFPEPFCLKPMPPGHTPLTPHQIPA